MVNLPKIFEKAYEYLISGFSELLKEWRKDKVDIISALDPKGVVAAVQGLQNELKKGLINVKNAVDTKEGVEEVRISNPEEIVNELSSKLTLVAEIIKSELGKIDKEIVIKNDLSSLVSLFKTDRDKKDLIAALKKIEDKVKLPEITDYTLILSDIADALDNIKGTDLSNIENSLAEFIKRSEKVDLFDKVKSFFETFTEEKRIKVILPDYQSVGGQQQKGLYGYSHTTTLRDKSNNELNPATEETLQNIAGLNYDTTSIDTSNPSAIVITYLKDSVLVATETITISGTTINIVKS